MTVQSTKYGVRSTKNGGQALVLVLLSLAVVLTIVLFVLSRSITDVSVSSNESSSVSAFSAAEAGVERALVIGTGGTNTIGDASYTASVTNVAKGSTNFIYPVELNSGDSMILWLASQDGGANYYDPVGATSFKVCWGSSGALNNTPTTPAIEVSIIHDPASAKIFRVTADPYSGRTPANAFGGVNAQTVISGQTFPFCKVVTISGLTSPQFAVIRMFYNTNTSVPVGFNNNGTAGLFPTQGKLIDSSGSSGSSTRKVQVFQGWPEIPSVFLYSIYSSQGLSKP